MCLLEISSSEAALVELDRGTCQGIVRLAKQHEQLGKLMLMNIRTLSTALFCLNLASACGSTGASASLSTTSTGGASTNDTTGVSNGGGQAAVASNASGGAGVTTGGTSTSDTIGVSSGGAQVTTGGGSATPGPDAGGSSGTTSTAAPSSGGAVVVVTTANGGTTTAAPAGTGGTSRVPTTNVRNVGINFFYNADWDAGYIFADMVKQGRYWSPPDGWPNRSAIDANGWPTADAQIGLMIKDPGTYDASGTYKLSFEASTGSVAISANPQEPSGSVSITNQAYSGGVVTADVTLTRDARHLNLVFRNTGNGIRNVRLIRPGHAATDVFAKDMLDALGIFGLIRPMQMVGEPSNPAVNWTQRRTALWPQQSNDDEVQKIGVSYEYLVMLANVAHKDLWLCLPRGANDDYITKVAQLVRFGSDGVNPYTSSQASPRFPPLDADLKLYVEYSNEVWNYNLSDEQSRASQDVSGGDPNHFAFDNSTSSWAWAHRRTAYKGLNISNIFRRVFGDAQMPVTGNARIRPVLATQIDFPGVYDTKLEYLNAVWGPQNTFNNPRQTLSYYFYALSGAPYPTFPVSRNDLTVDDIFAGLQANLNGTPTYDNQNVFNQIDRIKAAADKYGLKLNAYEGGQSLYQDGNSNAAKLAAQTDPRMKTLTKALLAKWYSVTDEPFVYFTIGYSAHYFRLGNGYSDTNTPKWQALKEIAAGQ